MLYHPFGRKEWARIDAGFLDPAYLRLFRAEHPGVDLNLHGTSGDGDLGYPVACLSWGVVEEVARDGVWGNVVLVRHDRAVARTVGRILGVDLDGLWSQYAHFRFVAVEKGQRVAPGQALGSVGKGGGERYLAHLHFELRRALLPALYWPGKNRRAILENYLDPAPVLAATGLEHRYVWEALIVNLQKPDMPFARPPKEGEV